MINMNIFPEITLDKNLFINKFGSLDFQSNFKAHNYDTNKTTNFLVNDFDWESIFNSGIRSKLFSNIKNINYPPKDIKLTLLMKYLVPLDLR